MKKFNKLWEMVHKLKLLFFPIRGFSWRYKVFIKW